VASPVKFAEYLMGGLQILISPRLGDYSDLVDKYNLGTFKKGRGYSFVGWKNNGKKISILHKIV
jgi:hypothetical protein